jgi:hypothetical protein
MSETNIWCAVLHLAIQDTLVGSKIDGTKQNKIRDTYEVRNYLTKPNADLNQVGIMAEVDPVSVREAMIKQIAAAPTPETDGLSHAMKRPPTVSLTVLRRRTLICV